MTIRELIDILKENNIDLDCTIECDTAWECGAVPSDDIFYDPDKKIIYLAQKYTNLEHFVGCVHLYGDHIEQTGFSHDYTVDPESKIVLQGEDKFPEKSTEIPSIFFG
jgi:hypothetical protein